MNPRKLVRKLEKEASFWRRRRRRNRINLRRAKRFQDEEGVNEALEQIRRAGTEIHGRDSLVFLITRRLPDSPIIEEVPQV